MLYRWCGPRHDGRTRRSGGIDCRVFEKLGGKLLCYYVTLGEFDWLLIAEFPNEKAASSGILVAMAGGSVCSVQTTVAMTSRQAMEAFSEAAAVAKSFKSAAGK